MAANIVQMQDASGNKQYPLTSSAAVGMSDGSGSLDAHLNKITTEYNVSLMHPKSGTDGSNKYTLETAIALVPAQLRKAGLKVSFVNADGKSETWEYLGGGWGVANFTQVGARKLTELENSLNRFPIKGTFIIIDHVNNQYITLDTNKRSLTIPAGVYLYFENKGVFQVQEDKKYTFGSGNIFVVFFDYSAKDFIIDSFVSDKFTHNDMFLFAIIYIPSKSIVINADKYVINGNVYPKKDLDIYIHSATPDNCVTYDTLQNRVIIPDGLYIICGDNGNNYKVTNAQTIELGDVASLFKLVFNFSSNTFRALEISNVSLLEDDYDVGSIYKSKKLFYIKSTYYKVDNTVYPSISGNDGANDIADLSPYITKSDDINNICDSSLSSRYKIGWGMVAQYSGKAYDVRCRPFVTIPDDNDYEIEVWKFKNFDPKLNIKPDFSSSVTDSEKNKGECIIASTPVSSFENKNGILSIKVESDVLINKGDTIFLMTSSESKSALFSRWKSQNTQGNRPTLCLSQTEKTASSVIVVEGWVGQGFTIESKIITKDNIQDVIKENTIYNPRLNIPENFYAIVGKEFNIYWNAITCTPDYTPDGSSILGSIECSIGNNLQFGYRVTPTESQVGEHDITFRIYDAERNELIIERTSKLIVVGKQNPSRIIRIANISSSTIDDTGRVLQHAYSELSKLGGNIPVFVGSRGYPNAKHEAVTGTAYTAYKDGVKNICSKIYYSYLSKEQSNEDTRPRFYWETESGDITSIQCYAFGSDDGGNFMWCTNNKLKDGFTGRLIDKNDRERNCTVTNVINNVTQQLMTNTSTQQLDFFTYQQNLGLSEKIDMLIMTAGRNGNNGLLKSDSNYSEEIESIKNIIDKFIEYNPSGKILLALSHLPCAFANKDKAAEYKLNIYRERELIFDKFNGYNNVVLFGYGCSLDRYYAFELVEKPVSDTLNPQRKRLYPVDYIHVEDPYGSYQIGDLFVSAILGNA